MIKFDFIRFGPLAKQPQQPAPEPKAEPSPPPEETQWPSLAPARGKRRFAEQPFIGWQSEAERHDVTRCILEGVRAGSALPIELYLRYSTSIVLREPARSARPPETNRSWLEAASQRARSDAATVVYEDEGSRHSA